LSNPEGPTPEKPSNDFIVLATIVRSHGLKGEVKVSLSCSGLDRLASCKTLRLVKDGKEIKPVTIIRSFRHPDGDAVVRFKEVAGIEEAETLRGAHLAILSGEKPQLPQDNYYLDDLIGLAVVTTQGESLGQIEEVMENLANGVCVVRKGEKEVLIPALKSVIREVDLKGRRMVVDLPEEIDADTAD
jgi:16S rRNA processing protein RimM